MSLSDRRVVVIGGTSGIGFAVAAAVAREGGVPVVASSSPARVEAVLARLPAGAEGYALDVTQEPAVQAFFDRVGVFDHLVYTAGDALQIGMLTDLHLDQARRFFEVRYWGALSAAKHGAPRIAQGGSIVFTSGIAGARPMPGWALGASICAGMEGLTRALAVELAPVRVNIVSPGFVRTELWDPIPTADRDAMYAQAAGKLPVGRVGEAADLGEAYLFLMRQGFATGQTFIVDGGGVLA